jgi:Utp11 protein
MTSSKTDKAGRLIADRGNTALSQEAVRLLKTQDVGYLRTQAMVERNKRRKLEEGFALENGLDGVKSFSGLEKKGEKIIYVESREEQRNYDRESGLAPMGEAGDDDEWEDDGGQPSKDDHTRPSPLSAKQLKRQLVKEKEDRALRKKHLRAREGAAKMLDMAKIRERDLAAAERELDLQRARMAKTPSTGGSNKDGVKYKARERKR